MNRRIFLFLGKQSLHLISLVVVVCIGSFFLLANSPIDPIDAYFANATVSSEQQVLFAQYWGFDKPPIERFFSWIGHIGQGDFGTSLIYREPVLKVVFEKALASLWLMMTAWVLSGLLGFALGVLSGALKDSWFDRSVKSFCILCVSVPVFWLGLLLLMVFAVQLHWFPLALASPIGKLSQDVTFFDRMYHLVLPALTLSITGISSITLQTREKMIEVMRSNFMMFAIARGESLSQRICRHGIRNVLLPAITLQFASFNELFGGAVLAETVFSYPGLGGTVTLAGLRGDYALLLGIAIFSAIFVFVGNLIAEILYVVVDPQIRKGGGSSL